ncbi:hypothetical protein ONE63_004412 [Megalurothrips usitatus]|uniref:Peptidase S1 domain-containing protein n=1 Tax=Megalurothrips usitatus TaxID=439358 RepID=A0AAV7X6S2_9NEOP|nr:hypothetical protein ONE63_004412 [Megalurothrips usitatus]
MSSSTLGVLAVAVVVVLAAAARADDLPEGSKCEAPHGALGLCKKLTACPQALADIRRKRPVVECSRVGSYPIVCCPTRKSSRNRTAADDVKSTEPAPTPVSPEGVVPLSAHTPASASAPAPAAQANATRMEIGNRQSTPSWAPQQGIGRIAREKCAEYSKYVFVEREPVTPFGDPWKEDTCFFASSELIIGGVKAAAKEFPHMARLGYVVDGQTLWSCGGSLISPDFVLTAAHCLYISGSVPTPVTMVLLGELDHAAPSEGTQMIAVAERIKHAGYKPSVTGKYDDIALLRLREPAAMTAFVRPACLHTEPQLDTDPDNTKRPTVSGWGLTKEDVASDHLLKVKVKVVTNEECRAWYRLSNMLRDGIRADSQVCAGDDGHDSCNGDSGGPLQYPTSTAEAYCMYKVAGVVSFGQAYCGMGAPGVYTRVYHYLPWIESIVWPQKGAAPARTTPPPPPVSSQPARPGWGQPWAVQQPAAAQGDRRKPVVDVDTNGDGDMVFPSAPATRRPAAHKPRASTTWRPSSWTQDYQQADILFPGNEPPPPPRRTGGSGALKNEFSIWTIR